jgi:serine/threonine protein kinase
MASEDAAIEALGYRRARTLSDGPLAEVVLVESLANQHRLAWKILKPQPNSDPESLGRFMDESMICQRLQHPNVIRSLGAGRLPNGSLYIATEYLEGLTLAAYLGSHGPLGTEEALQLFLPVCDGLQYVHDRGVVHRDLRPAKIFLSGSAPAYQPKLIDFGLAHLRTLKTVETMPGAILSRPEYCPPECVRGFRADRRSDIYALGITLYEAVTGAPPFRGPARQEVLQRHLSEAPPPLPASCAALAPIVERCLAKEPKDRFQTAAALSDALAQFGVLPSFSATLPSVPSAEAAPKGGDSIGPYELLRPLGEGAMSHVFLARHVALGRLVAIKLLKPEQAQQKQLVDRFVQEARAVNRIRHRNIVEIYDLVDEPLPSGLRRSYCVMEALEGMTLRETVGRSPLPLPRAVQVIRQVCAALEAAHEVGIIHRDVKPENIFVLKDSDDVKVLDFGVAKLQGDAELVGKTLAGVIIGTPSYMAPEQIDGKREVDRRADVYSTGVVLYELLSGSEPFKATGFLELAAKIASDLPPLLPNATPHGEAIPRELSAVVARCLEKDPAARFQSSLALSVALERFERAVFADPVVLEHRPKAKWGRWVAGAAGAAVLGLGAAVAVLSTPEPKPRVAAVAPAPTPAPSPPTSLAAAAMAKAPAPAPPSPATVDLTVTSVPSGARVTSSGGADLGVTPVHREMRREAEELPIVIQLDGYLPASRTVKLTSNNHLAVTLEPIAKAEVPAPPPERRDRARPTHRPPTPSPAAATAGTRTPPGPLPPPASIQRDDVMDPYAP